MLVFFALCKMFKIRVLVVTKLLILCQLGICAGDIEFYRSENYKDLLYKIETNTTAKCINFPGENGTLNVGSIRTAQCWILHGDPDCKSLSSEKITTNTSWESIHKIGSFQSCTEEIGGNSLHVSLTTYHGDRNEVPIILESYKDVCFCQNIPEFVQNWDKWSIDNHGNNMVAYFEQDCGKEKFEPIYIPAGHSTLSKEIYKYRKTEDLDQTTESTYKAQLIIRQVNENPNGKVNKILSFGPDMNASYFKKSCVKFNGTVIKFEIDDKGEFEEMDLQIDMFNNVFRNNEHYSMSRTYFVSKIVEERFKIEIDSGFQNMKTILVDEDFEVESNFDQNVFREQAIREVLRKAFSNTEENSEIKRNVSLNSFKTFSVKQVLSIPPCTEHKLNAYVNMLNNDRIDIRALMKIGGFIGERKMVHGEVKRFMDNSLEYKVDYDEFTVLAYGKGVVGMTFGTSLVVEGEDFAIPECVAHNQLLTCPACEVCY